MEYPLSRCNSTKEKSVEFVPGKWYTCVYAETEMFVEGNSYLCIYIQGGLNLVTENFRVQYVAAISSSFVEKNEKKDGGFIPGRWYKCTRNDSDDEFEVGMCYLCTKNHKDSKLIRMVDGDGMSIAMRDIKGVKFKPC